MTIDGADATQVLDAYTHIGIEHRDLAAQLQRDGADSFDTSWHSLLTSIAAQHEKLTATVSDRERSES